LPAICPLDAIRDDLRHGVFLDRLLTAEVVPREERRLLHSDIHEAATCYLSGNKYLLPGGPLSYDAAQRKRRW